MDCGFLCNKSSTFSAFQAFPENPDSPDNPALPSIMVTRDFFLRKIAVFFLGAPPLISNNQ